MSSISKHSSESGLPAYSIRISRKAKRVNLRVSPRVGLEVVVPSACPAHAVEQVAADAVARRKEWIADAVARLREQGWEPGTKPELPDAIDLQALGRRYAVAREADGRPGVELLEDGPERLRLRGRLDRVDESMEKLRRWLLAVGKRELPVLLAAASKRYGLAFEGVTVRLQRSRWGSCSGKGRINLNAKLLFLPPDQMEYVLLHELCHTEFMAHNAPFWDLLVRLEPCARELDKAVDRGWLHVPSWVG